MSQKRQPAGVPIGGQFAMNTHDEAGDLSIEDHSVVVDDLRAGDYIDLSRNALETIEIGDDDPDTFAMLGRWEVQELTKYDRTGHTHIRVRRGEDERTWVADGDERFDVVHPVEISESLDAEDLVTGDLVDMTRTIDEYVADTDRGGGDSADSIREMLESRGLYRVVRVTPEGDSDHTVTLSSTDGHRKSMEWFAMGDVTTFDYVSDRAEGVALDLFNPYGGKEAILRDLPSEYRPEMRDAIRAAVHDTSGDSAGVIASRMVDPSGGESAILRDFPDDRKPDARRALIAAVKAGRKVEGA